MTKSRATRAAFATSVWRSPAPLLPACLLLIAAPAALAEDSQPLSSRMMQMIGLGGGGSPAPEAQQTPGATPARPSGTRPMIRDESNRETDQPSQSRVLRMLHLTKGDPDDPAEKAARGLVECPEIVVDGTGAEMRSPAGADASSVAYQIGITRMARECVLDGDNIAVRVGLLGAAMLGPAGHPGPYYGSLKVALRRKSDDQLFGAKTYKVGAAIPTSESRADFTLLVENLTVPYISAKSADDYEIVVGFGKGAEAAPDGDGAKKPRRGRRRG
jgi:hypothetical protein